MDQPNNLRPYYNPGTFNSPIKLRQPSFSNYTTISAPSNLTSVNGPKNLNSVAAAASSVSAPDFDLDFGTTGDTVTEIGRSMMRLYGKIFFSQPFRVGRLLLQVGDWSEIEYPGQPHLHHGRLEEIHDNEEGESEQEASDDSDYHDLAHQHKYYERSSSSLSFRGLGRKEIQEMEMEEDDDDGEESYFTNVDNTNSFGHSHSSNSQHPRAHNTTQANIKRTLNKKKKTHKKKHLASVASTDAEKQNDPYINRIQPDSIKFVDIIGALQAQDGLKGLWRGVNTTFIMDAMQLTLEAWFSGFFSSISGVPDPHFLDISHSTTPGASLVTAVTASVVTAVLLSPLSIIRTRMITTTFDTKPRSVRTSLRNLESFFIPSEVFLPTVLYSGTQVSWASQPLLFCSRSLVLTPVHPRRFTAYSRSCCGCCRWVSSCRSRRWCGGHTSAILSWPNTRCWCGLPSTTVSLARSGMFSMAATVSRPCTGAGAYQCWVLSASGGLKTLTEVIAARSCFRGKATRGTTPATMKNEYVSVRILLGFVWFIYEKLAKHF